MEHVEKWKEQFIKEGESPFIATIHAIQRAYECGHIEEDIAEMLEQEAKNKHLKAINNL